MTTLSVARALVELKTLDARINKTFTENLYTVCKTKQTNCHIQESEFKKQALANFQSVNDLIERRALLKNAIIQSNSRTMVEISGRKITVSEAIEFKHVIKYKTDLLVQLKGQRYKSIEVSEKHREKVQLKIDNNVQAICGKEKQDSTTIQSITEAISKGDPIEIFDPLNIETVIANLTKEIEDFTANVDYVLSESNALTTIVV